MISKEQVVVRVALQNLQEETMSGRKLWYMLTLLAFVVLPLAGCGGSGSSTSAVSKDGYKLTVSGDVEGGKSLLKTLFAAAPDLGTITVINAQDGTTLGTGPIDSTGTFSNLAITLPAAKSVLVFKADVSLAGSPFRTIVPIDLSNPPAAGISASNTINISISQQSTDTATAVSAMLGVTGLLGEPGATLSAAGKTYIDAVTQVANNGGQVLAYNTSGLALTGSVTSSALLPAKAASTLTYADLQDTKLDAKIISAFIPGKNPIVNFQITDKASGKGITGLRTINLIVAQLKPELDGSNSYWQAYRSTSTTAYGPRPNFEQVTSYKTDGSVNVKGMTIIDHGDGTYTAIFATDVTAVAFWDATLTHRIGLTVQSVAVPGVVGINPGAYAGPINPATGAVSANFNTLGVALAAYDFIPATGIQLADTNGKAALARDIVTTAACNECHAGLGVNFAHAGRRADTRICVMCHTPQLSSTPYVDGKGDSKGEFVSLIHKIHMGSKLALAETTYGTVFKDIKLPMDIRNCTACHKGTDTDNWKTKPSMKACSSCHNDMDFATHKGGLTTDASCAGCHNTSVKEISASHTAMLPATADATKRTMSAAITGVTVDATSGTVTANFTVSDGGVAVTDLTAFSKPTFVLAKLEKDADGVLNWVGYTNQFNTKNETIGLVKQTKGESSGTLVANADGSFSYTFALTGATAGDIRTVTHAHNVATVAKSGGKYSIDGTDPANLALYGATVEMPFAVSYEPTKTHRVAMTFSKNATATTAKIDANNAWFDFVPAGGDVTETRNIVKMGNCAKCHAGSKLHAAYEVEVCVTCHNPTTRDPGTGETVSLENIVHKLHMGSKLPSVVAGGSYKINVSHDYSKVAYPAPINNCATCHVEGTGAPKDAANWYKNPTKAACMSCHDGVQTTASHGTFTSSSCASCHGSNRNADVKSSHRWW